MEYDWNPSAWAFHGDVPSESVLSCPLLRVVGDSASGPVLGDLEALPGKPRGDPTSRSDLVRTSRSLVFFLEVLLGGHAWLGNIRESAPVGSHV